jgi:hypothetical protein
MARLLRGLIQGGPSSPSLFDIDSLLGYKRSIFVSRMVRRTDSDLEVVTWDEEKSRRRRNSGSRTGDYSCVTTHNSSTKLGAFMPQMADQLLHPSLRLKNRLDFVEGLHLRPGSIPSSKMMLAKGLPARPERWLRMSSTRRPEDMTG